MHLLDLPVDILIRGVLPMLPFSDLGRFDTSVSSKHRRLFLDMLAHLRLEAMNESSLDEHGARWLVKRGISVDTVCLSDCSTDETCVLISQHFAELKTFSAAHNAFVTLKGLSYLHKSCRSLCSVDLSSCLQISDSVIHSLVSHTSNTLQQLRLASCHAITDKAIVSISTYCRGLCFLDVSQCYQLTDVAFNALASAALPLEELYFSQCIEVTDDTCIALAKTCHRLRVVDVSGCHLLTDAALRTAAMHWKRLQHLDISYCTTITDTAVRALFHHCKHLSVLRMRGCGNISDASLKSLTDHTSLVELDIQECGCITDEGITHIAKYSPELITLNMSGNMDVSDASVFDVAAQCCHLQDLRLSKCSITGEALIALATHCRELSTLDISHCRGVSDRALVSVLTQCSQLRSININHCSRITRAALSIMASSPRLQHISIAACHGVKDADIIHLLQARCESIRSLDISHCRDVTDAAMLHLLKYCPVLNSLSIAGCGRITDTFASALCRATKLQLRELYLDDATAISEEEVLNMTLHHTTMRVTSM